MSWVRALLGVVWDALADACLTDGRGGSVLDGMRLTSPPPITVTIQVDHSGFEDSMRRLREITRQAMRDESARWPR